MTISPTNERATAATDRANDGSLGRLREAIRIMLSEHGYDVESRLDGLDLRFHAVTDDERRWRTQILLDEQHAVARLYVYLDLECAALRREWVLELVCRVNSLLAIGAFDFDWDTGEVAFRHGRDFTGQLIIRRRSHDSSRSPSSPSGSLLARWPTPLWKMCRPSGRWTPPELPRILPWTA